MNTRPFYETVQPDGMYLLPSYVHGLRAGNTIYVAGQVPKDENGKLVAPGDAGAQARQAYANLTRVLKAAGADWSNVVKITTYLVDRADSHAVRAVRLETLGEHRPPHTGLIVAALGDPEARLEVEVIAVLPDR
jgi:2-iminobutanoate/2-iminopropanoate deaminase